jgi:serine phosphatase RsbU (regulator of sigma subunit)
VRFERGGIPPYIRRSNGEVERIQVNGFPLGHGLGSQFGYQDVFTQLREEDILVVLGDGAVESKDQHNQLFGFGRLQQTLARSPNGTAQALLEYLVGEVMGYLDANQPQDDFTIVAFKVTAAPG